MDKLEIKKSIKKMLEIQSLLIVIILTGILTYYTKYFYVNKTLTFTVRDTKILIILLFMIAWLIGFGFYFWLDNRRLLKLIIYKNDLILDRNGKIENQNDIIQEQNNTIQELLHQVLQQNEDIENKTNKIVESAEEILEQGDYIIQRSEEQHVETIKSNRNLNELILLDRSDDIA